MDRLKLETVYPFASAATTGKTPSIHGVGQGPSAEKIRCMSTHRWTLRSVRGRGNS